MSLYNYLVKSDVSGTEIRWDFRREEEEQLYNLLKGIGLRKYLEFVRGNLKDILKYISLSPSQRKQKTWVNHPDNLLIRCAALQIADITRSFLLDIREVSDIVDGGSYRSFEAAVAQGIAPLILQYPLSKFPFDGFDNPFRS
jgi:hypothetical protein